MQTESVVAAALEATAATSTEMASTPKTTTETKSTLQPLEPQNETETPKLDNSNLQTTALGVSDSESIQPTSTRTRRIQSTRPTESPKALKRLEVTTESEPWGNPTANVSSETPPPSRMASPRAAVRTMKASSTGGVNGDANGRQMDTGLSATDISQETTADKKGTGTRTRIQSDIRTTTQLADSFTESANAPAETSSTIVSAEKDEPHTRTANVLQDSSQLLEIITTFQSTTSDVGDIPKTSKHFSSTSVAEDSEVTQKATSATDSSQKFATYTAVSTENTELALNGLAATSDLFNSSRATSESIERTSFSEVPTQSAVESRENDGFSLSRQSIAEDIPFQDSITTQTNEAAPSSALSRKTLEESTTALNLSGFATTSIASGETYNLFQEYVDQTGSNIDATPTSSALYPQSSAVTHQITAEPQITQGLSVTESADGTLEGTTTPTLKDRESLISSTEVATLENTPTSTLTAEKVSSTSTGEVAVETIATISVLARLQEITESSRTNSIDVAVSASNSNEEQLPTSSALNSEPIASLESTILSRTLPNSSPKFFKTFKSEVSEEAAPKTTPEDVEISTIKATSPTLVNASVRPTADVEQPRGETAISKDLEEINPATTKFAFPSSPISTVESSKPTESDELPRETAVTNSIMQLSESESGIETLEVTVISTATSVTPDPVVDQSGNQLIGVPPPSSLISSMDLSSETSVPQEAAEPGPVTSLDGLTSASLVETEAPLTENPLPELVSKESNVPSLVPMTVQANSDVDSSGPSRPKPTIKPTDANNEENSPINGILENESRGSEPNEPALPTVDLSESAIKTLDSTIEEKLPSTSSLEIEPRTTLPSESPLPAASVGLEASEPNIQTAAITRVLEDALPRESPLPNSSVSLDGSEIKATDPNSEVKFPVTRVLEDESRGSLPIETLLPSADASEPAIQTANPNSEEILPIPPVLEDESRGSLPSESPLPATTVVLDASEPIAKNADPKSEEKLSSTRVLEVESLGSLPSESPLSASDASETVIKTADPKSDEMTPMTRVLEGESRGSLPNEPPLPSTTVSPDTSEIKPTDPNSEAKLPVIRVLEDESRGSLPIETALPTPNASEPAIQTTDPNSEQKLPTPRVLEDESRGPLSSEPPLAATSVVLDESEIKTVDPNSEMRLPIARILEDESRAGSPPSDSPLPTPDASIRSTDANSEENSAITRVLENEPSGSPPSESPLPTTSLVPDASETTIDTTNPNSEGRLPISRTLENDTLTNTTPILEGSNSSSLDVVIVEPMAVPGVEVAQAVETAVLDSPNPKIIKEARVSTIEVFVPKTEAAIDAIESAKANLPSSEQTAISKQEERNDAKQPPQMTEPAAAFPIDQVDSAVGSEKEQPANSNSGSEVSVAKPLGNISETPSSPEMPVPPLSENPIPALEPNSVPDILKSKSTENSSTQNTQPKDIPSEKPIVQPEGEKAAINVASINDSPEPSSQIVEAPEIDGTLQPGRSRINSQKEGSAINSADPVNSSSPVIEGTKDQLDQALNNGLDEELEPNNPIDETKSAIIIDRPVRPVPNANNILVKAAVDTNNTIFPPSVSDQSNPGPQPGSVPGVKEPTDSTPGSLPGLGIFGGGSDVVTDSSGSQSISSNPVMTVLPVVSGVLVLIVCALFAVTMYRKRKSTKRASGDIEKGSALPPLQSIASSGSFSQQQLPVHPSQELGYSAPEFGRYEVENQRTVSPPPILQWHDVYSVDNTEMAYGQAVDIQRNQQLGYTSEVNLESKRDDVEEGEFDDVFEELESAIPFSTTTIDRKAEEVVKRDQEERRGYIEKHESMYSVSWTVFSTMDNDEDSQELNHDHDQFDGHASADSDEYFDENKENDGPQDEWVDPRMTLLSGVDSQVLERDHEDDSLASADSDEYSVVDVENDGPQDESVDPRMTLMSGVDSQVLERDHEDDSLASNDSEEYFYQYEENDDVWVDPRMTVLTVSDVDLSRERTESRDFSNRDTIIE